MKKIKVKSNKKKAQQLRMPYGTACNRLRKLILFRLIKETKKDICHHCKEKIKNVDELSIEHKIPWLDSDNPLKLFFDIRNITFSHLKCNCSNGRRSHAIDMPKGKSWCYKCKKFKDINKFWKSKNGRKNGLHKVCIKCEKNKGA